ncbi:MAG: CDP-alcohol phosphatidyltransferase family protein [Blastocatellia bacterium]
MTQSNTNRRPIRARSSAAANALARWLTRHNISPNQISLASIFFAAIGAWALLAISPVRGALLCAVCIQLRLLCNLFDGMVAIEGGRKTPTGDLYNEFPDRVADSVLLVALGYACGIAWLGWFNALGAALTAYIRVSGAALGLGHDYRGPMAKQQRMAVMTLACLATALEWSLRGTHNSLAAAAGIIAVGVALTCCTRTMAIAGQLRAKA